MVETFKKLNWKIAALLLQGSFLSVALEAQSTLEKTLELTSSSTLLDWQAAFTIEDTPKHLEIAKSFFRENPSAFSASLLIRSYSQNLQVSDALNIYKGPYREDLIKKYPDVFKDLAWASLESQMSGASIEQILTLMRSLYLVRDRRMAPLVLMALQHSDLRVNMQALNLVESYALDIYKDSILTLWKTRTNLLLKARIFALASHLDWPESLAMADELKEGAKGSSRDIVIALADHEMRKKELDLALLLSMSKGDSLVALRMASWCLRYQESDAPELLSVYQSIFERKDSVATLLALDSLLHFHLSKTAELSESLDCVRAYWPQSVMEKQVDWLRAVSLGQEARVSWIKSFIETGDSFAQTATAWALAARFSDSALVSYLWDHRSKVNEATQIHIAWALIETSSKHSKKEKQEALALLSTWVLEGSDYWCEDSHWPGLIEMRESAPSWMPLSFVRPAAVELRLSILEDIALREPEKAYDSILKLYLREPETYLSALMSLSWSQGKNLDFKEVEIDSKQARLIKALIKLDDTDKAALQKEYPLADERFKDQIMNVMLQLADQTDLEFFISGLDEPTRLSIKSACGILTALRQGTQPQEML